jgi:hypothetical protein
MPSVLLVVGVTAYRPEHSLSCNRFIPTFRFAASSCLIAFQRFSRRCDEVADWLVVVVVEVEVAEGM